MTLLKPQLALTRLLVIKDGKSVYDQRFHLGLNVIRGTNGSGKSTIADFIFFALGGELSTWHEEMKLCDYVYAEVLLNRQVATLRRDVSRGAPRRAMAIFWGAMDVALARGLAEWAVYPFAAFPTKESFSQVVFRALDIPEVRGELSSRLTTHQLLRLMYVDQMTAVGSIFRAEQFDPALTRDAVGTLVCGIYDSRLYEAQLELSRKQLKFDQLGDRLDNIFMVLGGADQPLDAAALTLEIAQRENERSTLYEQISGERTPEIVVSGSSDQRVIQETRTRLSGIKKAIRIAQDELETIQFEIADSDRFIAAMQQQTTALDDSIAVRRLLGGMRFEYCPACYSVLEATPESDTCYLCQSDVGNERSVAPVNRIKQEVALQIRESEQLQTQRIERREELLRQIPALQSQRQELQLRLNSVAESATSDFERSTREAYMRIGYIDREIMDLQQRLTLANSIAALREAKAGLAAEISKLKDEIDERQANREVRRRSAYRAISEGTVALLRRDLPREERFIEAARVDFDFAADRIAVDDVQVFAASSMTYLKNSFHLALHMASLTDPEFRYPRFSVFDNIEDKGMEEERSHNFQRLMLHAVNSMDVEHQIIMTTSMLAPELDNPEWVIGPYYTIEHKSLQLGGIETANAGIPN